MNVIKDTLAKDIDRIIDGVIKADDASRIRQEVAEYVLTNSIEKQLQRVVDAYHESVQAVERGKEPYPINGAWISGYFGSGKSHLLKILAYLLDHDQEVELREIFLEKVTDQFLKGNLQTIFRVPSKSILFNIDQMADGTKGKDENTILLIFEKAMNKLQGFYYENRYIAAFERHLTEEGDYEAFKEAFRKVNGTSWEESRSKAFGLGRSKLIAALRELKSMDEADARDLIDHYKRELALSVEDFAKQVRSWLDSHDDSTYRVSFFIDEVGQFIAENVSLMLNLQTMAETLATVCNGRAWIFVTSQEDLDKVIGDPDASRRNDFTKIQARFKQRISLSSGEVQEVIQERLLKKEENAVDPLGELYQKEKENFRTIFSFRQGGKDIYFKDRKSFINSYPFQAYQYYLLQQSLRGLSEHNAFMGRHVSRGERSMLEIFQDVTKSMKDELLYKWATFDRMFAGIRFTLKTELLEAVNLAEQQLDSDLPVRLLKILLMVKYVRDFRATIEHLAILLVEDLSTDIPALTKEVEKALELLVGQFYIERNGEVFQYLTNEEKDIEKEISNVAVENASMRGFYADVVFQNVLKSSKIRYSLNNEDYLYKKAVDDEMPKAAGYSDLTIRLITALHPQYGNRDAIVNQSSGKKELLVFLESDRRFYTDLVNYFRTDIYTRQNIANAASPQAERIMSEKQRQNSDRRRQLVQDLTKMIGKAELYVFDNPLALNITSPADRIAKGFEKLITKAYPHLRMLQVHYDENSLQKIMNPDDKHSLLSGDAVPMGEDEQEVLNFITRKDGNSEPISIASVEEAFTSGQYGWYPMAIICVLAKLVMRNKVEIREGGDLKNTDEINTILTRNRDHRNYAVKPAAVIDSRDVDRLKKIYHDFLHKPAASSVAKEIVTGFKKELLEHRNKLQGYHAQRTQMPFLKKLEESIELYSSLLKNDWSETAKQMLAQQDDILQHKEETDDPIVAFMEGEQQRIWLEIKEYQRMHAENLLEIGKDQELEKLEELLESDTPYRGGTVNKAKRAADQLRTGEREALEALKEKTRQELDARIESLTTLPEYAELKEGEGESILKQVRYDIDQRIKDATSFSSVRDRAANYAPARISKARQVIITTAKPAEEVVYASPEEIRLRFSKQDLVTEEDVIQYSESLKNHFLSLIRNGKRIGL